MFFSKGRLSAILALLSLTTISPAVNAYDCCDCCPPANRMYVGAFGGELFSDATNMTQLGTAFFEEDDGGPLAIDARGSLNKTSPGFGGLQIGYEWAPSQNCGCSNWSIAPAAEIEAFYYQHNKTGTAYNGLIRSVNRLDDHDFLNSFKLNTTICLVNAVFSLKSPSMCGFVPYVGAGVGFAHLELKNADSFQVAPPEAGVNHFNSGRCDTSWAFAAQAKAGLRYNIWNSFSIFAEYRYVFVDVSNYILGSTDYNTHAPTSAWNFKLGETNYNAFAIGIQFDL